MNIKQSSTCLEAVICDWRLGRRRSGIDLGDCILGLVTDRPRRSRIVWMCAAVERRSMVIHRAGKKAP